MRDTSRERAPEEKRLLELAARRLPGGVLGSARFPDELAFVVNTECLARGVVKGREKLYVSLAHSDEDVARTLDVFEAALRACRELHR
jgi:hypothetical protein